MTDYARWNGAILDAAGNVFNGASVEVRNEATAALATIYSDRTGASPLANPFTAANGADVGFHVAGGSYKITITAGADTRIFRYVAIGTAAEHDFDASIVSVATVTQTFALTGDISPNSIASSQNDYNPANLSTSTVLRLSSSAAVNITGLQGGADGRVIVINNVGTFPITLVTESGSSTAANRFALGASITLLPADTIALIYDATSQRWRRMSGRQSILPRAALSGFTLSNGTDATNDIDIAAGACRDSTDIDDIVLSASITKQLDAAWAVGSGVGGRDTGSIADTTWHVWVIKRSDTGVVDALFSTSATAPTMPTNYDRKRRIGSIIRSSGTIVGFSQDGDEFLIKTISVDVNIASIPATTAQLVALLVPIGIKVKAIFNFYYDRAASDAILFTSPDQNDAAPNPNNSMATFAQNSTIKAAQGWIGPIRTNTSGQVRYRVTQSAVALFITTMGWIDRRGRDD